MTLYDIYVINQNSLTWQYFIHLNMIHCRKTLIHLFRGVTKMTKQKSDFAAHPGSDEIHHFTKFIPTSAEKKKSILRK